MNNLFTFATFGGAVAILTFILSSGDRLKGFISSIMSLWLERVSLDDTLSAPVYRHCLAEMGLFGFRAKVFSGCMIQFNSDDEEEQLTAFEILKQSNLLFRKGFRFLRISPGDWRFNEKTSDWYRAVDLSLPRLMWNSTKFLEECLKKYNEDAPTRSLKGRFFIKRFYGANKSAPVLMLEPTKQADRLVSGAREMLQEMAAGRAQVLGRTPEVIPDKNPFDWYAFPQSVMDAVENARQWKCSRKWHQNKHIPWRRGWLLHGDPGTGKSLLAKCLAQDLDLPIFLFDLASMSNEEFETFWNQALMESPCMILLEDFDAVFHGRENQTSNQNKLTFDCLLNCMSGVEPCDGLFLIMTTNHLNHIDSSLAFDAAEGIPNRPGRIDEVIHVGSMDADCRRVMAERILEIRGADLDTFVETTEGLTSAQFIETCNRRALQMVSPQRTPEKGVLVCE